MAELFDIGIFSVEDTDGSVGVGWKLNFYIAGTSTRQDTYPTEADANAGTNANTNPVIADASGRFAAIWLKTSTNNYKAVLTNASDVVKVTRDPANTGFSASAGSSRIGFIQSGAGAVARTAQAKMRDTPSPYDFDITEGNDSTTGFQEWLDACKSADIAPHSTRRLIIPVSETLSVDAPATGTDFTGLYLGNLTLLYSGTRDRPAFHVDGTAGGLIDQGAEIWLPRVIADGALQWPGTLTGDDCGIMLEKVFRSRIYVPYVEGFTKGYELRNSSYNSVEVGHLQNNEYAEVLATKGAEVLFEYTNQNIIYGGRRGCSSAADALGNAYGTAFAWDEVSSGRGHNSNTLIKPCYELGQPASATYRVPLYMKGVGNYNVVKLARIEGCKGPTAIFDGGGQNRAHSNVFDVDYNDNTAQTNALLQVNDAGGNVYTERGVPFARGWHSGDLRHRISSYGAAGAGYMSGDVFTIDISASTPSRSNTTATRMVTNTKAAQLGGAACLVAIDTTKIKTFRISSAAVAGFAGRPIICAFNSAGTRLTGDATDATWGNEPYVKPAGQAPVANANYGGNYQIGNTDGIQDAWFTVRDEVTKIYVGWVSGTNVLGIQSFEVTGYGEPETNSNTSARVGLRIYADVLDDGTARLATAKPDTAGTVGYFTKGQKVFNASVAAAATDGWVCSTAGYLAAAWAISTAYSVLGHVVTNDSGKMYELVTGGTSAGSGGPTGTGAAITDGTCVWDYVGVKAVFVTSAVTS